MLLIILDAKCPLQILLLDARIRLEINVNVHLPSLDSGD